MMDTKRLVLYSMLFFIVLSLWSAWQRDLNHRNGQSPAAYSATTSSMGTYVPSANSEPMQVPAEAEHHQQFQPAASARLVTVKTDVLEVAIDTLGGDLVNADLLKYKAKLHEDNAFTLLNQNPDSFYLAQSGILSDGKPAGNIQYQTSQKSYQLQNGQESLVVELQGKTDDGIAVKKIYQFKPGQYQIGVRYEFNNNSSRSWNGNVYTQLVRKYTKPVKSGFFSISSYVGASISDPANKKYEKITFKQMNSEPLARTIDGGWLAQQQHYFLSAWVPAKGLNRYYSHSNNDVYTVGATSPSFNVPAGQAKTFDAQLYLGPELTDVLEKVAPGLELTIDYGWLWFFSAFIFSVMKQIHGLVGNWGWSIILVTCLIKLLFYPLSAKSYRSMAAMKKLQPRLEALKERYENDKQKLTQATWELYQKEKVNPFGGCLPILIQIPVFIALYWVLLESVELRQAPFILWIHDLSAKDPYFVLPVIMGLSMLLQQFLNPPAPDPVQQKMMMLLPLFFTVLFLYFPAGLVLYWVVNNCLSIAQQFYITRQYELAHKK